MAACRSRRHRTLLSAAEEGRRFLESAVIKPVTAQEGRCKQQPARRSAVSDVTIYLDLAGGTEFRLGRIGGIADEEGWR